MFLRYQSKIFAIPFSLLSASSLLLQMFVSLQYLFQHIENLFATPVYNFQLTLIRILSPCPWEMSVVHASFSFNLSKPFEHK